MPERSHTTNPGTPPVGAPWPKPPSGISPRRGWQKYAFPPLEKVSKVQALLVERLEWLMPSAGAASRTGLAIQERLKELLEDDVRLVLDHVQIAPPRKLAGMVSDPTFLAILTPAPQKARGLLEVSHQLAHAAIEKLLGGSGEQFDNRRLTDIEEGVMEFIILEVLKTLAPNLEQGLPRMRLAGTAKSARDGLSMLQAEEHVAVVQFKCTLGGLDGFVRALIPATLLGMTTPPPDGAARRARRRHEVNQNGHRLQAVRTWLRAEIGRAEVTGLDLQRLGPGDVVLLDEISARPDRGEGGTARLKVGAGRAGYLAAAIELAEGHFKAKVTKVELGEDSRRGEEPSSVGNENPPREESTDEVPASGSDLVNDIPLQIAVELGRVQISGEQVLALKAGQVIDLNRAPGEPVELSVNGKVVARGELVEVEGHLGVRVLSLVG